MNCIAYLYEFVVVRGFAISIYSSLIDLKGYITFPVDIGWSGIGGG
jgi:hypothetical protein